MKLRIQDELEASALVPSDLLCYQLEKVPKAPTSTNSPQCPFFFSQMLTYILSFLPLSDQKEASLVSWAWCCAAQNALREVRYLPSPGPFSLQLAPGPAHASFIHSFLHTYSYMLGSGYSAGALQMNKTPLRSS